MSEHLKDTGAEELPRVQEDIPSGAGRHSLGYRKTLPLAQEDISLGGYSKTHPRWNLGHVARCETWDFRSAMSHAPRHGRD